MFGKRRKETRPCAVCHEPAVMTKASNLDVLTPPATMTVNQHNHPLAETPFTLYLCAECADIVAGFVVYLMEEKEKKDRELVTMERLKSLNVGTVLTVIEKSPHPMPNEDMKTMLEGTPFSGIWKQEL